MSNYLMRSKTLLFLALVQTIAAQPPLPSLREVRDLFSGKSAAFGSRRWDQLFHHEARLRPALRRYLHEPQTRENATEVLALIGETEDVRTLIQYARKVNKEPLANRWAYFLVCALLEPRTEEEWRFLGACARNDYNDRWVDAGAIQTLKLIASPKSLLTLKEAAQQNLQRERSIAGATAYIESAPPPLISVNLDELVSRIADVIRKGESVGRGQPRYNTQRNKALVDLVYENGSDRLTYTATFHHVDNVWKLRGVRETLQEFILRLPLRPTPDLTLPPVIEPNLMPPQPAIQLDTILGPTARPASPQSAPASPGKK